MTDQPTSLVTAGELWPDDYKCPDCGVTVDWPFELCNACLCSPERKAGEDDILDYI